MALSPYYGIFDPFAGVDPFAGPDPFFALGFPTQTGGGMTGRSRVVDYPMVNVDLKSLNRRQFSIDLPAPSKRSLHSLLPPTAYPTGRSRD